VLVIDYRLQGMTGADVVDLLRKDERTARVPVFILSNYLGDQDGAIDRVFAAGVLAWLKKPATPPRELARKLLQAVSSSSRPKG
jgi:CheY-like chemotaxis protein